MQRFVMVFSLVVLPGTLAGQGRPLVESGGTAPAATQTQRQTGFLVHQMCIVPGDQMAEYNRIADVITPVLNALQSEGMIRAWYDLRHAWGDEWNVGIITVADSHRAWLDYFDEFLSRVNAADPSALAQVNAICQEHKDNMYNVRDGRGGSR